MTPVLITVVACAVFLGCVSSSASALESAVPSHSSKSVVSRPWPELPVSSIESPAEPTTFNEDAYIDGDNVLPTAQGVEVGLPALESSGLDLQYSLPDALSSEMQSLLARSDSQTPPLELTTAASPTDELPEERISSTPSDPEDMEMVPAEDLPIAEPLVMDLTQEDMDYYTVLRPPPMTETSLKSRKSAKKTKRKQQVIRPTPTSSVVTTTVVYVKSSPTSKNGKNAQNHQYPSRQQNFQSSSSGTSSYLPSENSAQRNRVRQHEESAPTRSSGPPAPPGPGMGLNHHFHQSILHPMPLLPVRAPHPLPVEPVQPFVAYPIYEPPAPAFYNPNINDQNPSGAVQVLQSIPAGEHHSQQPLDWFSGLASPPNALPVTSPPIPEPTIPPLTNTDITSTKKSTLKDVLAADCPGAEELGYCDSPPRQQVAEAIQRCSDLLDHMYTPIPDDMDLDSTLGLQGETACPSLRRTLRPGYVRDATSGRWLVALQSKGRVSQSVAVERCSAPGRPCARLADSKCARNLGFRNGARATTCEQRTKLTPLLTWDPETPTTCPRMRMARFPSACVCHVT